jgi:hypothetical protein
LDPQRTSAADGILHQIEGHRIPDNEIIERGTFLEVAPMEIDLAFISQPDEPVTLSNEQPDDAAR